MTRAARPEIELPSPGPRTKPAGDSGHLRTIVTELPFQNAAEYDKAWPSRESTSVRSSIIRNSALFRDDQPIPLAPTAIGSPQVHLEERDRILETLK